MLKSCLKTVLVLMALATPIAALAQMDISQITEASSAILGAGKTAAEIRSLQHVPSVGVIHLNWGSESSFSHLGNEIATLRIYEERNAGGIAQLRHALGTNQVTRRALASHGITINQVMGVSIGSSGSLRVFVD
jgi:hypothetical protein